MDADDWRYRCLCNTHVRTATIIICVFGIIANVVFGAICVFFGYKGLFFVPIFGISIFSHISLFVGNRKKIRYLYWPYIFANSLLLITSLLAGIVGCVAGATIEAGVITTKSEYFEPVDILISGIIFMSSVYLQIFFSYIVISDYRYLQKVLLNPESKLPRVS